MYVSDRRNHSASPEMSASDCPCVGHCFRMKTLPSRRSRTPSTAFLHCGQRPLVYEWNDSRSCVSGVRVNFGSTRGSFNMGPYLTIGRGCFLAAEVGVWA